MNHTETMRYILRTIYWSGHIGDQIVIWTLFWSVVLPLLFAAIVWSLGVWAGIPPLPFALDFVGEATVALSDPVLTLVMIAAGFASVSFLGRWLLQKGKDQMAYLASLAKGHPLLALFLAMLLPFSFVLLPWIPPPVSMRHPFRRNVTSSCTLSDLSRAFPSWNRPPPAGVFC